MVIDEESKKNKDDIINNKDENEASDELGVIAKNSTTKTIQTTNLDDIITIEKIFNTKKQYVPPLNFSLVEDGIYRSGFPQPVNYEFLKKLKLKLIIYLGDLAHNPNKKLKEEWNNEEEIMKKYEEWISTTSINFHKFKIDSTRNVQCLIKFLVKQNQTQKSLISALKLILDKNNFPMLIHSNKGKHRTGLLVGLMRKLFQGWCLSGIFEEYESYTQGKLEYDLEFIELWQPEFWICENIKPNFVRV